MALAHVSSQPSSARMRIAEGTTLTESLIFSVTRFVRGDRRIGGVRFSSASARLSPTAPQSPSAMRFELGSCNPAATSRLWICPGCTTRSFEAGFTITDGSTARKLIDRCANWTERWRVGRHGNTRNCTVVLDARHGGSLRFLGAIRGCLRTGRWVQRGSIVGAV